MEHARETYNFIEQETFLENTLRQLYHIHNKQEEQSYFYTLTGEGDLDPGDDLLCVGGEGDDTRQGEYLC